ncbi:hydroperoxide isomerase ALOXE3 [Xenopus laevis]|uniref:Arachidonate lipoxygenase 3 n=2 Tax=Xenopus laevis TaxID=8355 RepID=A0A974DQI7_XENLA|nr:hydroperoxide isomerase ALOXE3 [Xenopus laevis]OCT96329.1 hypothetical protein XELAEV_18014005mg [Xenopus laevis]
MVVYKIYVTTGKAACGGTHDSISIVLIGEAGESEKHQLDNMGKEFCPGTVNKFKVHCKKDLGKILIVRLYKEPYLFFHEDPWLCNHLTVKCPNDQCYQFPYYQWISDYVTVEIPERTGIILANDVHPIIRDQRRSELEKKKQTHQWKTDAPGTPSHINFESDDDLSPNDKFSLTKRTSFGFHLISIGFDNLLTGLSNCTSSWNHFDDIKRLLHFERTHNSDLVPHIWKEDTFFGYQYLNGVNPVMIQKCTKIPGNFPVNHNLVSASLGSKRNLEKELQSGNIFLADYKILHGIPANVINDKKQFIAAPICLLWKTPQDNIVPIAIQLNQTPGEENPIFLPTDPEWDWTLAKIWVRNSEFQVHEVVSHLLHTHLFAEIFNIATTRHLPLGHPVYKLLIPHLRFTLEINVHARKDLVGPEGLFDKAVVTGSGGVPLLIAKAMKSLTYSTLCLPDDIQTRGVKSIPNYFYRDDGMLVWQAVENFVSDIVNYYYKSNNDVANDPELQAWVAEIFHEGFLSNRSSGIPSSFATRAELIKYLTMVIYTCSAQHSAVNGGQYDFYSWMPNGPSTMRKPPSTAKGTATLQSVLDTLPAINTTVTAIATVRLLSIEPLDRRPLGHYPDEHFIEDKPKRSIKDFKEKLARISRIISDRKSKKKLWYQYLNPKNIENSISI